MKSIKELRNQMHLTQGQIAKLARITVNTYQRYEYRERIPNACVAIRIANALHVTVEQIWDEGDDNAMKVIHKPLEQRNYYTAEEVMDMMNVAKPKAYQIIQQINAEEEAKGRITIPGRVLKRIFKEKCL